eukprot:g78.t1
MGEWLKRAMNCPQCRAKVPDAEKKRGVGAGAGSSTDPPPTAGVNYERLADAFEDFAEIVDAGMNGEEEEVERLTQNLVTGVADLFLSPETPLGNMVGGVLAAAGHSRESLLSQLADAMGRPKEAVADALDALELIEVNLDLQHENGSHHCRVKRNGEQLQTQWLNLTSETCAICLSEFLSSPAAAVGGGSQSGEQEPGRRGKNQHCQRSGRQQQRAGERAATGNATTDANRGSAAGNGNAAEPPITNMAEFAEAQRVRSVRREQIRALKARLAREWDEERQIQLEKELLQLNLEQARNGIALFRGVAGGCMLRTGEGGGQADGCMLQ